MQRMSMRVRWASVAGGALSVVFLLAAQVQAAPELVWAFAFNSRDVSSCEVANEPGETYTLVLHGSPEELTYDEFRGWGYEVLFPEAVGDRGGYGIFGPFDDSANNRNQFPDGCPEDLYDSFIGAKNFTNACDPVTLGVDPNTPCSEAGVPPEGIIFRADVPPGNYRFVAAVGSPDNAHASRILAEDGGSGPPPDISAQHVVLVSNYDQGEHGIRTFGRVGFGCFLPPDAAVDGFVNMDEDGMVTTESPNSPTLTVTENDEGESYIRIHQLQGNSTDDPNGGNMVILELWRVDDEPIGQLFSVSRAIDPAQFDAENTDVNVTLSAANVTSMVTVSETYPAGWTVTADGGGTVNAANNTITFEIMASGSVSYTLNGPCERGDFSGSASGGGCSVAIAGDATAVCIPPPPCSDSTDDATLVEAFMFGADSVGCNSPNDPTPYTEVLQTSPVDIAYSAAQGYGFEEHWDCTDPADVVNCPYGARGGWGVFGPFDDSANRRGDFPGGCPEGIYNSFIGFKDFAQACSEVEVGTRDEPCEDAGIPPDGGTFRVDVPNGTYRFVAALGDADNVHAHRLLAEDGGEGPPQMIDNRNDFVVLINTFDQNQFEIGDADGTELGEGVYARVGFDGRLPPAGDGLPPSPNFVNMDEFGDPTDPGNDQVYGTADDECPNSPTLTVTQGYIRFHMLQGNSNDNDNGNPRDANGGDMVILEIWSVEEDGGPRFVRGDINTDGGINIADPVFLLNNLFGGGPPSTCAESTDVNDDGGVNIADPVYLLNRLFGGGPPVPAPNPDCGEDPNEVTLGCVTPAAACQ